MRCHKNSTHAFWICDVGALVGADETHASASEIRRSFSSFRVEVTFSFFFKLHPTPPAQSARRRINKLARHSKVHEKRRANEKTLNP